MLKKFVLSVFLFSVQLMAMAQGETVTHVVQRGETIESIAENYQVSTTDITKANPETEGIIYVGMKLRIPQHKATAVAAATSTVDSVRMPVRMASETLSTTSLLHTETPAPPNRKPWHFKVMAGVTAGTWVGKDFKKEYKDKEENGNEVTNRPSYQFHVGVVADYFANELFYGGFGLFYNRTGYWQGVKATSGRDWLEDDANFDSEQTVRMLANRIDVPLHLGFTKSIASDIRGFAEAGIFFSYTFNGYKRTKTTYSYYEDIHSGWTERSDDKVKIGKDELSNYTRLGAGFNASAGVAIGNVSFQFTYQRGFLEVLSKKKKYEQNYLLSLGYEF